LALCAQARKITKTKAKVCPKTLKKQANKRKKPSLWAILSGAFARSAAFLAAFAQGGVAQAVHPSAKRNQSGKHSPESVTT
jgi:hypothetical protein